MAVLAFALPLLLAIAADRLYGLMAGVPSLPAAPLLFPPFSEQSFATGEFRYAVRTNAFGLRERELPEDPALTRILAIGDSFTYGWGVEAEATWLRVAERYLNEGDAHVFTINAGRPGAGPESYADLAARAIPALRPSLVLVCITVGNDIAGAGPPVRRAWREILLEGVWHFFPNITRALFSRSVRLPTKDELAPIAAASAEANRRMWAGAAQAAMQSWSAAQRQRYAQLDEEVRRAFEEGDLNPYLIDLAMKFPDSYNGAREPESEYMRENIAALAARLGSIRRTARHYGADCAVVAVPDGPLTNDVALRNIARVGYTPSPDLVDARGPMQALARACERAGVPLLDVLAGFREHRADPDLFFRLDGHLASKGHALFGRLIADALGKFLQAGRAS